MDDIACGPDDPGWWGKKWEDGKRLARLACYKTKGTPNYHMQPVEGIDAGMASDSLKKSVIAVMTSVLSVLHQR